MWLQGHSWHNLWIIKHCVAVLRFKSSWFVLYMSVWFWSIGSEIALHCLGLKLVYLISFCAVIVLYTMNESDKNRGNNRFVSFELTSKVGSVSELHLFAEFGDDAGHSMLNEVHLFTHGPLANDVIVRLEDLKLQLTQHSRHKVRVCICKQRHGGHQLTTVKVHNFLWDKTRTTQSTDIKQQIKKLSVKKNYF